MYFGDLPLASTQRLRQKSFDNGILTLGRSFKIDDRNSTVLWFILSFAVTFRIDRRLRSSDILDIDELQFGFQSGKSTLHYLYKLYHDILAMKNLPIATVYDLEKTFDSVDQTLLLSKLKNNGVNDPLLATIKSFYRIGKCSSQ